MKRTIILTTLLALAVPAVAGATTPAQPDAGAELDACIAATPLGDLAAAIRERRQEPVEAAITACAAALSAQPDGPVRVTIAERLLAITRAAASKTNDDLIVMENVLRGTTEPDLPNPTTPTTRPVTAATRLNRDDPEAFCPGPSVMVGYDASGTVPYGSFTLSTPDGTQQGEYDLPLKTKSGDIGIRFCVDPGEFLYLSVQNPTDSGKVGCSISVDGVKISEIESSGGYVIASCDGSA